MTRQGKYNLLGIIMLPLTVVAAAAIATANGVWEAYGATYLFLFGLNLAIMLVAGLLSGLLLLWAGGERSRWFAVAPTILTALIGNYCYRGGGHCFPAAPYGHSFQDILTNTDSSPLPVHPLLRALSPDFPVNYEHSTSSPCALLPLQST